MFASMVDEVLTAGLEPLGLGAKCCGEVEASEADGSGVALEMLLSISAMSLLTFGSAETGNLIHDARACSVAEGYGKTALVGNSIHHTRAAHTTVGGAKNSARMRMNVLPRHEVDGCGK